MVIDEIDLKRFKIHSNRLLFYRSCFNSELKSGVSGVYFKTRQGVGVKIFDEHKNYHSLKDINRLVRSKRFLNVFTECALFNIFYENSFAKVCIYVDWDLDYKKFLYSIGMSMPHFRGRHLQNATRKLCKLNGTVCREGTFPLIHYLQIEGQKKGMYFNDLHSENLVINNSNQPRVVDFESYNIIYYGNKKKLETEVLRLRKKFADQLKKELRL